jgi:cell division protein FtsB
MSRFSTALRREWLSLILGAVLMVLLANCIWGPLNPRDLALLTRHREALEARRTELIARNAELRTTVQKLGSDRRTLEHLIRRELGYTRAGELVYRFPAARAAATP